MLTVAVMLLLAQSEPVKVALPGLTYSGIEAQLGDAYVERFATLLGRHPLVRVTTRRDIEQLLGMERQKVMLGCAEGSSTCLAELAGGLGVDALLSGSLAKTGSSYTVTMRVLRASTGAEVASTSERLKDEDALSEWLEAEAPRLAERIGVAFGRVVPVPKAYFERWIPALIGAGLLIAGSAMEIGARIDLGTLKDGGVPLAEISGVLQRGKGLEVAGWVLIGVGAASVAASVIWALAGKAESPRVSVIPLSGGAFVSLGGAFP